MIDRIVFGMHHLNITQIGSKYDWKKHLSHGNYELDLAGEDAGVDFWFNKMPNTWWKIVARFGNKSTGNTYLFHPIDPVTGAKKKVMCADGVERYVTLAMTHSNANGYYIGKVYKYGDVMYQEGTAGYATGNHIHLEVANGLLYSKSKINGSWNLNNMLDARKVFFILDGFTKVVNTCGLYFEHCSSVPYENTHEVLVTTANLNLRSEPNGKIIKVLPKGTEVNWFWESIPDWYKVYIPSMNLQGWCASAYLKKKG